MARFATAVLAFASEASATTLAPEYALAFERDDACVSGGPSCSLALSQLRASSLGPGHLKPSGRPNSQHVFEAADADLALLASGVPASNVAALLTREALAEAVEIPAGKKIAPAVLHSDLPWAAAAAREAEQKAEKTTVETNAQPLSPAEPQAPRSHEARPQLQTEAEAFTQPVQPQPSGMDVQPYVPSSQTVLTAAEPLPATPEAKQDKTEDESAGEKRAFTQPAQPQPSGMDVQPYMPSPETLLTASKRQPATSEATQDKIEDEAAGKKRGGRIERGDASKASLARSHHGATHVKAHGKKHESAGSPAPAFRSSAQAPDKGLGSFTKAPGGYKDVVLAGPGT